MTHNKYTILKAYNIFVKKYVDSVYLHDYRHKVNLFNESQKKS